MNTTKSGKKSINKNQNHKNNWIKTKWFGSLEARIAVWQSSNPAFAEEIDHAVPEKQEQEPTIHLEPTEPSPEPSESEPIAGVVEPEQEGGEG